MSPVSHQTTSTLIMISVPQPVAALAECQTLSLPRTIIAEVSVTSTNAFALSYGFVEAAKSTKILIIVAICHFQSVPFVLAIRAGIHSIANDNAIIILAAIWAPVDTPTPSHCEVKSHNRYYILLGPFLQSQGYPIRSYLIARVASERAH